MFAGSSMPCGLPRGHHGRKLVFMKYLKIAVAVTVVICAGCGDNTEELKALRKDVAQLKTEIRGLRQQLERKHAPLSRPENFRQMPYGTNGVRRVRDVGGKIAPTKEDLEMRRKMKEEFEARRKAMQDPEFRKKFEAERKQRMEERRRMHEERLREVKARREADKPKAPEAPADQAK